MKRDRKPLSATLGLLLFACAGAAGAQEKKVEVEISTYLWAASLKGAASAHGLSGDVDATFRDTLQNLDVGGMAAARVQFGRWGLIGDLQYLKSSVDGDPAVPGYDEAEVESSTLIGTVALGYRVKDDGPVVLDLFGGVRGWDLDLEVRLDGPLVPALESDDGKGWIDPIVGMDVRWTLDKTWAVEGLFDVGGFDVSSHITAQLFVAVHCALSDTFRLTLGYRYLMDDYEDAGFVWDMAMHGMLLGVTGRF